MSQSQVIRQAGAIPFRQQDGHLEYCLITSSSQPGIWTLPKGSIEPGDSPETTALKESLEEAGIEGRLVNGSLGSFTYRKNGGDYEVEIFLMLVTQSHERWDESDVRKRQWVSASEAARILVGHPAAALFASALSVADSLS